jgi:hypothetical protein
VQWQVPGDEAEEDSDESDDDDSDITLTVTTDIINWYTDLEYCKRDINGSVETINWQFKTEMGEDMTEDDDVGMEQWLLDYFMACFPPQAMRNIINLTNKKLSVCSTPKGIFGNQCQTTSSSPVLLLEQPLGWQSIGSKIYSQTSRSVTNQKLGQRGRAPKSTGGDWWMILYWNLTSINVLVSIHRR